MSAESCLLQYTVKSAACGGKKTEPAKSSAIRLWLSFSSPKLKISVWKQTISILNGDWSAYVPQKKQAVAVYL